MGGRSQFTFRHRLNAKQSEAVAASYLTERGLKFLITKAGEAVWKNGNGIVMNAGFMTLYYEDYKTTVFAWIQTNMGLTARNESDLSGFGAALPKRNLSKVLEGLKSALESAQPDPAFDVQEDAEDEITGAGVSGLEDHGVAEEISGREDDRTGEAAEDAAEADAQGEENYSEEDESEEAETDPDDPDEEDEEDLQEQLRRATALFKK